MGNSIALRRGERVEQWDYQGTSWACAVEWPSGRNVKNTRGRNRRALPPGQWPRCCSRKPCIIREQPNEQYRIAYSIQDEQQTVCVVKAARRRNVSRW